MGLGRGLRFAAKFQGVIPRVLELIELEGRTQQAVADILNSENHRAPDGKPLKFQQVTICRLLKIARAMSRTKHTVEVQPAPKSWDEMTLEERFQVVQAEEQEQQKRTFDFVRSEHERRQRETDFVRSLMNS